MKKVILVVAMVFATGSLVNANTGNAVVSEVSGASEGPKGSCIEDAWDFGTSCGGSYFATNWYYNRFC